MTFYSLLLFERSEKSKPNLDSSLPFRMTEMIVQKEKTISFYSSRVIFSELKSMVKKRCVVPLVTPITGARNVLL